MKKLDGMTALVTGASNGIGRNIARSLAEAGANIIFSYRNELAAKELTNSISKLGNEINGIKCDFSDDIQFSNFLDLAFKIEPHIQILVNNVGILQRDQFIDITSSKLSRIMKINFERPFHISQKFAKLLIKEGLHGSIINISSVSAFRSRSRVAHYQSSKAALSMLTKSIATELGSYNIRANTICPGLVATNANRNQWENNVDLWKTRFKDIPLSRPGTPNDFGQLAVFLASNESSWITGSEFIVDGGMTCL